MKTFAKIHSNLNSIWGYSQLNVFTLERICFWIHSLLLWRDTYLNVFTFEDLQNDPFRNKYVQTWIRFEGIHSRKESNLNVFTFEHLQKDDFIIGYIQTWIHFEGIHSWKYLLKEGFVTECIHIWRPSKYSPQNWIPSDWNSI